MCLRVHIGCIVGRLLCEHVRGGLMVASGETAVLGAYRYSVWRVTYIVTAFALRPLLFHPSLHLLRTMLLL